MISIKKKKKDEGQTSVYSYYLCYTCLFRHRLFLKSIRQSGNSNLSKRSQEPENRGGRGPLHEISFVSCPMGKVNYSIFFNLKTIQADYTFDKYREFLTAGKNKASTTKRSRNSS